ncbi:MAG: hypothetical protein WD627_11770 [Actinomycetota bacterium]
MTTQPYRRDRIGIVRATLELETAGRSPSGALIAADGRRRVFSGWAELGAALEDWRTEGLADGVVASSVSPLHFHGVREKDR